MKAFKRMISIVMLLFLASSVYAQEFVSPIGFVDNEANRKKVMEYIKKQVKEDAVSKGETYPDKRLFDEYENLKAFKRLIKVKNTDLLQKVIKECCEINLCNYVMIFTFYQDEDKNYPESIEW